MSLTGKIDFAVVFEVKNANPNGDPLNSNVPRMTDEGFGEVSDVCLKRKIRDRLMELGQKVFVQPTHGSTDGFLTLKDRSTSVLKDLTFQKTSEVACKTWFDVRAFGQVLAFKGKKAPKGKKAEGEEETSAAKGVSCGIRGPVTVQSAFSLQPIRVTSLQITKSVSNEGDGLSRGSDTMGMKHRVDRGIYRFFGSMSPQLATRTGFSDEDAEVIKGILPKLFENDASSARPDGSMRVLHVVWWKHDCPNGNVSSAKIQASLSVDPETGNVEIASVVGAPKPQIIPGF